MLRNVKTGQPIILRPKVEIEGLQTKASTNPTRFHWWARRFYFDSRPTADTAIQVWYRKQPVLWSDGPCQLDEVYDPIVELYSQVVAFQFYREFDKSQFAETQATNYIGKMNLPLRENKKNDYMSGIQVRTR
jgi:hypothetical protein